MLISIDLISFKVFIGILLLRRLDVMQKNQIIISEKIKFAS